MASVPEIKIARSESLGHGSEVWSPEAKLGMRVEDLWDEQKPQLSPDEKLNACFETIPVSAFPLSSPSQSNKIPIYEDEPVLQAFKLMRRKRIGGIPVIERKSEKPVGNISLRDVHFLLTAPEIYHDYRSITTKNFLEAVREHLEKGGDTSAPILSGVMACTKNHTLEELILMLDAEKIHRLYVVDDAGNLEGLITLRDIIARLVYEPPGYFGDFFDGVIPLPQNYRV